jgi:uncharacterized protein (TIGR02145 family)
MFVFISFFSISQNPTIEGEQDNRPVNFIYLGNSIKVWKGEVKMEWMARNYSIDKGRGTGMNVYPYGRTYTWENAMRACPIGWHLPSDNDWKILEFLLGMNGEEINQLSYYENYTMHNFERESGEVGKKLKSESGWKLYFGKSNGIDKIRFNALPGGYYNERMKKLMLYGYSVYYWTSTSYDSDNAIIRELSSDSDGIQRSLLDKEHKAYIRCIRD